MLAVIFWLAKAALFFMFNLRAWRFVSMTHMEVTCREVRCLSAVVWVRCVKFKWMTSRFKQTCSHTKSLNLTSGCLKFIDNRCSHRSVTLLIFIVSWMFLKLYFQLLSLSLNLYSTFLGLFLLSLFGEACFGCNRLARPPQPSLAASVWAACVGVGQ